MHGSTYDWLNDYSILHWFRSRRLCICLTRSIWTQELHHLWLTTQLLYANDDVSNKQLPIENTHVLLDGISINKEYSLIRLAVRMRKL